MEEAYEIVKYLPRLYKEQREQEYIEFLWDAFESNYENKKYQFAFMGYHMLFMSFVYFNVWKIKNIRHEDFQKIKLGFSDKIGDAENPFMFSVEGESKIFDLLKYLCTSHKDVNALIGKYKSLVKERNNVTHANGSIPFRTVEYLEEKIKSILLYAQQIQEFSEPLVAECFLEFLIDSQNKDLRAYPDISNQIREALIHKNYLSGKDLEYCINFDISVLSSQQNFDEIEIIHQKLKEEYLNE